jgi:hypothetical protein
MISLPKVIFQFYNGLDQWAAHGVLVHAPMQLPEGILNILIWAHQQGYKMGQKMCGYAARGGHLEILKWAKDNELIWDHLIC